LALFFDLAIENRRASQNERVKEGERERESYSSSFIVFCTEFYFLQKKKKNIMRYNEFGLFLKSLNEVFIKKSSPLERGMKREKRVGGNTKLDQSFNA